MGVSCPRPRIKTHNGVEDGGAEQEQLHEGPAACLVLSAALPPDDGDEDETRQGTDGVEEHEHVAAWKGKCAQGDRGRTPFDVCPADAVVALEAALLGQDAEAGVDGPGALKLRRCPLVIPSFR